MILAWHDEGQLKPEDLLTLLRVDELMKAVPMVFLQKLLRQRLLTEKSWIPNIEEQKLDPAAASEAKSKAMTFLGVLFATYLASSAQPNPALRLIKAVGWNVLGANPDFPRAMDLAMVPTKENMGVMDLRLVLTQLLGASNKFLSDFKPEDFLPGLVSIAEEFNLGEDAPLPAPSRELVVIPPQEPPATPPTPPEGQQVPPPAEIVLNDSDIVPVEPDAPPSP
jgi:hypothetical protein